MDVYDFSTHHDLKPCVTRSSGIRGLYRMTLFGSQNGGLRWLNTASRSVPCQIIGVQSLKQLPRQSFTGNGLLAKAYTRLQQTLAVACLESKFGDFDPAHESCFCGTCSRASFLLSPVDVHIALQSNKGSVISILMEGLRRCD